MFLPVPLCRLALTSYEWRNGAADTDEDHGARVLLLLDIIKCDVDVGIPNAHYHGDDYLLDNKSN